jgi:hypothetical protein
MLYERCRILGGIALISFGIAWSPLSASELTVVTSHKECRRLVTHKPDSDVAYKPGVDVRGKFVAPADLPSDQDAPIKLAKVFEFPISINPLSGGAGQIFSETRLELGKIRFDRESGDVSYNGRPLRGLKRRDFVYECQKLLDE